MAWGLANDGRGSPKVILTEPTGSSAEVNVKSPKTIRGGIPISFPQFCAFGSLEHHDFLRNRLWALNSFPSPLASPKNNSLVDLILKPTEEDLKIWPHKFELRLRVILGPGKLVLIPRVRNTDSKPFSFTFSMRNYLFVSDISEVRIEGLETLDYYDNLKKKERFTEQTDSITFDGEIDRMYLSTPSKIAVIDHERRRTLVVKKEGLPDAALWNPWTKKAKAMANLGHDDYETMLCLDSAVAETPIVLRPFEEWRGRQELSVVSSSYCSGQLDPRRVLYD